MTIGLARCGAILASTLMFALCAGPELPWVVLMSVALIPWLATLDGERDTRAVFWSGTAMSVGFVVAVFAWFAPAISRYTDISLLLSFGLLILAAPFLQPQFIVFAVVRHRLAAHGRGRIVTSVAAACAWVGTEWVFPRLFGDTLGHALFPFATLRQGADIAGVAGLTFVILLVNESLLAAMLRVRSSRRQSFVAATPAIALVSLLAVYGAMRLHEMSEAPSRHPPLTAALVQANLDDYEGLRARLGVFDAVRRILDTHEGLSLGALDKAEAVSQSPVELLIWPEGVYPTTFGKPKSDAGGKFDAEIVRFARSTGVPLWFGTYDRDDGREYNSAVLLQPGAGGSIETDVYRKRRLFPLTEKVPAWLDTEFVRGLLPWLGTWTEGDGPALVTFDRREGDDLEVAPLICLDAVDPSLAIDAARRGADLILTLSNDGWFGSTRGARLHLVVSAFRSIETRLPQLRATNTGITAVITAAGDIVGEAAIGLPAVLTARVDPGARGTTLMIAWGDWFGPVACLIALLALAVTVRRR